MAILKLYSDIQTEEQKSVARWWGEVEGTSFNDVAAFCEALPDDDPVIELHLHSNGGSVSEGWSIYDRLRATGKEIHAIVEGKAASMATVILMAAPKENRRSYENAEILIHNPYILTGGTFTADELARLEREMRKDQEKILDLYVDRCSDAEDDEEKRQALREELQKVMDEDVYITPARAMELGLIGEIIPPVSAKADGHSFKQNKVKEMKDEKTEVKQSLLNKMLAKLGFKSIDEVKFGMDLNTADGQTLTVEREEGSPEVGDKATPDGEHVMPDGSTIVVVEGVITEIKPADTGADGDGDGKKGDDDDPDDEVAALQARIEELEAENEDLKKQLEEAGKNAKSVEDMKVLNAVAMAGGADKVLAKIQSNYKPATRKVDKVPGENGDELTGMAKELADLKAGKLRNKGGRYIPVKSE
jgi:ATP-dependent Clp protease protease subunit